MDGSNTADEPAPSLKKKKNPRNGEVKARAIQRQSCVNGAVKMHDGHVVHVASNSSNSVILFSIAK